MNPTEVAKYVDYLTETITGAGRATTQVTVAEAMDLAAEGHQAYPVSGDDTTVWVFQECQP